MLSRSDSEVAHRDRHLQLGMTLLFDEVAFAEALSERLRDVTIERARAVYVRYKPGTSCLVAYRLSCGTSEFDVYAKAFSPGERAKFRLTENQRIKKSRLGPGCVELERESVIVSFFPNDDKIRALKRGGPDGPSSKLLRKLVPSRCDLWEGSLETLRYKPERRFVARVASTCEKSSAVLKLYAGTAWREASENAQAFTSRGVLRVASLLGVSERYGALALEWLDGAQVDSLLIQSGSSDLVAQIGEALAEFHSQRPDGLRRCSPGSEIKTLLAIGQGLEQIAPRESIRVEAIVNEIADRWSQRGSFDTPVHGDFYAGQLLLSEGCISILDLDEAVWGNPMSDLGNFLAHLERDALLSSDRSTRLRERESALIEGYARAADRSVNSNSLAPFTAASLLKLAHHPFRLREPDWLSRTNAIIGGAEELLGRGSQLRIYDSRVKTSSSNRETTCSKLNSQPFDRGDVYDPMGARNDVALPFLSRALDPLEASVRLQKALEGSDKVRGEIKLQEIRVLRHKPGRRCVVQYKLAVTPQAGGPEETLTLIGKARARNLDKRCYPLLIALREAGFCENSRDGIAIPEPVVAVSEFHMWLQLKAPGVPAGDALMQSRQPDLARRVAGAVLKLQRAGVMPERRHTIEDELRVLDQRLTTLALARPNWRDRLERVMEACRRLGGQLEGRRLMPAHRDFYADQVLVDDGCLYLLDFDLYALADPALDAGNFIAHLTEQSLRQTGSPKTLEHHEQTISEELCAGSDVAMPMALRHYVTLALVRHIDISTRIPGRHRYTEAILEICEQRLDLSGGWAHRAPQLDPAWEEVDYANSNV